MFAYYRSCRCSTSTSFISTSTTAGWSYCSRCGDTMLPYIVNDSTGTTITNTFGLLPLKNWRWFHGFAKRLLDWSHEVQNQVQSVFMPRRQQGKVVASQQRRHKRKSYLLRLGAA